MSDLTHEQRYEERIAEKHSLIDRHYFKEAVQERRAQPVLVGHGTITRAMGHAVPEALIEQSRYDDRDAGGKIRLSSRYQSADGY